MIETPKLIVEAFEDGVEVEHVIVPAGRHVDASLLNAAEASRTTVFELEDAAFDKLADSKNPQAGIAVAAAPPITFDERFDTDGTILVLFDVADPGNVGTILRTAEASGVTGVVVVGGADVLGPKVIRAAAGSLHRVPIGRFEPDEPVLATLGSWKYRTLATVLDGRPHDEISVEGNICDAILFGSEAHGLPPDVVEHADVRISIPMSGRVESLNVATAAAVLAFDMRRRHGGGS